MKTTVFDPEVKQFYSFYRTGILLPLASTIPEYLMNEEHKRRASAARVRKMDLNHLKDITGLSDQELCYVLKMDETEYVSENSTTQFSYEASRRIIDLAAFYTYGYAVFNGWRIFNHWMKACSADFAGRPPVRLIHTVEGMETVRSVIDKIDLVWAM